MTGIDDMVIQDLKTSLIDAQSKEFKALLEIGITKAEYEKGQITRIQMVDSFAREWTKVSACAHSIEDLTGALKIAEGGSDGE